MIRSCLWLLTTISFAATGAMSAETEPQLLAIPLSTHTCSADEGCRWMPTGYESALIRSNAHYLAAPQPDEDWGEWLDALRHYRTSVRDHLNDPAAVAIDLRFDGVRAWTRLARSWAWAIDLVPGERLQLSGEVRWLGGNDRLCLAFDVLDRAGGADGAWQGWSRVVAAAQLRHADDWQPFEITTTVPPFDAARQWTRPILGMDETFDNTPGQVALRRLEWRVTKTPSRADRSDELQAAWPARRTFDDSLYLRADQQWMTRNFVCGFLFVYDRSFWDPERQEYRIDALCADAVCEFGGYDSVVIWQAYPRIGADQRNQFDFFRDMPGGLEGVRGVVRAFHRQGIRVFLPYNPWDTGTRREPESDDQALARLVAATEVDGLFLDTMLAAPTGLRQAVDAARPGVAFEPEGHPSIAEIERCSASWAQWLDPYPEIGVLHLKWIEPRHMQHQIRRWDKSHQGELAAAWLNGSGILVWENIFGSWNPWQAPDRATLRRMAPVWRHFADHFSQGNWLPYFPVSQPGTYATCWEHDNTRLWTFVRPQADAPAPVALELDDRDEAFFDLWQGVPLTPVQTGARVRLEVPVTQFGAVVACPRGVPHDDLHALMARQRLESRRPIPGPAEDGWVRAKSVVEPAVPASALHDDRAHSDQLPVDGGTFTFKLRHMRRECGCYPDPGTPPSQWEAFLTGMPHDQTLEHHVTAEVADCRIDTAPVTNGQFAAFLDDSGYRPVVRDNFLKHWGAESCPAELRDRPVVYVDIDDARAYAAWAGRRLPSEWEWQRGAAEHGEAFQRGEVWEWTESVRDDGHTRFVMLRGGCRWQATGSIWYFPTGPQPIDSHAKFLLLAPGLDRCASIGFRCVR